MQGQLRSSSPVNHKGRDASACAMAHDSISPYDPFLFDKSTRILGKNSFYYYYWVYPVISIPLW